MIQIDPHQVTPQLRALFAPNEPQPQRCFAVLDGHFCGKVWTDGPINPSWGIVLEPVDGSIYLGGWPEPQALSQVVAEERKNLPYVLVGLWFEDQRAAILPPNPDYVGAAVDFSNRPAGEGLDIFLHQMPEGYAVRRMDRALFERCLWHAGIVKQYGSADDFLKKALGFCLMHGNEIPTEVYCYPQALGKIEISVETHEPFRGHGYATFTCAHAIQVCEALGYQTHWNCAKQNLASAALARKLGYRTEQAYKVVAWHKEK